MQNNSKSFGPFKGVILGDFCYQTVNRDLRTGGEKILTRVARTRKRLGEMPIMVMSQGCNLHGMGAKELINKKEEDNEMGGYFIVNGNERVIRLLQMPKRNHPQALIRSSYQKRGPGYSDLAVSIRCANANGDQSTATNFLHYITTGDVTFRFVMRKQEFVIPVMLIIRSLSNVTDEELYNRIVQGDISNTFVSARVQLLLGDARRFGAYSQKESLTYLGSKFRYLMGKGKSLSVTDEQLGHTILRQKVLIHLYSYEDKLECLLLMLRKLYATAGGKCNPDNADSLQNQELLLPGHLMSTFMKEKVSEVLDSVSQTIQKDMQTDFAKTLLNLKNPKYWAKSVDRFIARTGIGASAIYLLSTGNIRSKTGLDLLQQTGFTVMAEKINFMRYLSHFRAVHRGQFFTTMRTTAIRKLLPDQWGFLCPVHTPDGAPCGLLSHLAINCTTVSDLIVAQGSALERQIEDLLISFGMLPKSKNEGGGASLAASYLVVCLDGRVLGYAAPKLCKIMASRLRQLKVDDHVPSTMEVAYMAPPIGNNGPFPGLFLSTSPGRMVRPVLHRASGKTEYIGPMEQPFMDIACLTEDIREGITTHQELDPTNILSLVASLTPYSDYNQSPRNMYQCQMAKQTMGTPCHNYTYRTDTKLFRRFDIQSPVVQTSRFREYKMDEYPNGCNAVVAVLSYTGFDMEDAMIINKNSLCRGFGHGTVYKNMVVDLEAEGKVSSSKDHKASLKFTNVKPANFERVNAALATAIKTEIEESVNTSDLDNDEDNSMLIHPSLGIDGLPIIGSRIAEGSPIYCFVDDVTGKVKIGRYKEKEPAMVQHVRRMTKANNEVVHIVIRIPRIPVVGDKFASRHGQKGILSILWPQEDMPFTEMGVCPDVIINPHAFPSRMTIGMLIESMAGKSGALHGMFQDATPFSFHETGDKLAVDYFGEQLQAAGFNYYGSEPLYSGVSGQLLQADLYIGIVFYQRLRHMVSDKFQVRSSGKRNPLTRQPVGGRKQGGGIRLGEMERDSLLSHGAAFVLMDRLLECSDKSYAYACRRCGDLLSPCTERNIVLSAGQSMTEEQNNARLRVYCRNEKCRDAVQNDNASDEAVQPVVLPYVYRFLINELASMNIKMICKVR